MWTRGAASWKEKEMFPDALSTSIFLPPAPIPHNALPTLAPSPHQ